MSTSESQNKDSGAGGGQPSQVMHEHVYDRLRDAIIHGQLAPGRAVSVRSLAAEFDVSAMPAREAIKRLVAIGALDLTDTRRVKVASISQPKLDEIKLARVALEPVLARYSLQQVDASRRDKARLLKTLRQIDSELDRAIERGDAAAYAKLNCDFHFALYRAADAQVLLGLVESLWLQFGPFMRVIIGRVGTSFLQDDEHKKAIDAIEQSQADVLEAAVRRDVADGMDMISGHALDEFEDAPS